MIQRAFKASVERSDSTAVPAASVVCEAVVATEVAKAMLEKFDSDSFEQMKEAVKRYRLYSKLLMEESRKYMEEK